MKKAWGISEMMAVPGQHTAQPKWISTLPCPILQREATGLRAQRQGRVEVFFRETGNLWSERLRSGGEHRAQAGFNMGTGARPGR